MVIIACRFVLGLAIGGASVVISTLLAELAPTKIRGSLVSQDELMIAIEILLAYVFNGILENIFNFSGIWRYMIVLSTISAIILWVGIAIVPETPRWLASRGKVAQALEVLRKTRADVEGDADLEEIQIERGTFKDLGTPWIPRLVLIGCIIAIAQQLAGINVIMYHGTTVSEHAGFGLKTALLEHGYYMHYLT